MILFVLPVVCFCFYQSAIFCDTKMDSLFYEKATSLFFANNKVLNNSSDAIVRTIFDREKKSYIIKQIVINDKDEQFLLLRDFVSSFVGVACSIPVNNVWIIPAKMECAVKTYQKRVATIHAFVDGKSLEDQSIVFLPDTFTLQQRFYNPYSPWQKKYPIKMSQQGLTRAIIESMVLHQDLPKIVAFDTFVGNADRSLPNIFYDEQKNCFYGIDHAAAFNNKILAKLAYMRIEELIHEGYFSRCDKSVINGLQIYVGMLERLYAQITPDIIHSMFDGYSPYIFYELDDDMKLFVKKRSEFHVKAFEENYAWTEKLIELLRGAV